MVRTTTMEHCRGQDAVADALHPVADALHEEYAAIVAAGFTRQIDDPFRTDVFSYHPGTRPDKLDQARLYVNAVNR